MLIELENAGLVYVNGVRALSDITLKIEKGDFVFLVGPTGCGKSSLMKLVYLDEFPTEGRVEVNGRDTRALKPVQVPYLRRSMGVVFQDYKLLSQKTAWENIAFAMQVIGSPPREIEKHVSRVLDVVGLMEKQNMYPEDLSGGEQQRVSIARALVNNPPLLLADEPTGNLDPATSWDIIKLLQKINLLGTTIVVSTHNRSIVDAMGKRVIALVDGKIVSDEEKGKYFL